MIPQLSSLTIFFPFYNDQGTVEAMLTAAFKYGRMLTPKLQVIAIHGGPSKDQTLQEILRMKKKLPIQVIDKTNNTEGYAVIKYGLQAAKSDWVFYTDGDGQYDLKDLLKLVKVQSKTNADVVNGFKLQRHDSWFRKLAGSGFQRLYSYLVGVPIRDIHCDFRLIRRQKLKNIALKSKGATIISELILKLDTQGATFVEIGVTHHDRVYGRSNYRVIKLIQECGQEIAWCLKYKGSKGV